MLKKPASFVLISQESSTYPEGTPPVLASPAALLWTRRVSARQGWEGEKSGLFEHPADLFHCPICALAIEFSPWHDGFSAACRSSIEAVSIQLPASTRAETTSLLFLQAES
jgi:hypothetical protein